MTHFTSFGDWTTRIDELKPKFANAEPFPHVVIDSFLNEDLAQQVFRDFPIDQPELWYVYDNPIEHKKACDKLDQCAESIQQVFRALQSDEFLGLVRQVTGISNLENDPHMHGAGLHFHENGGHLGLHLDYDIHPVTGKQRRVNIIIFLNPKWVTEEYHGELEFWDRGLTHCVTKIAPVWNRMALFQTTDISYHGLPTPITIPLDSGVRGRMSLAIYYVSDPELRGETDQPLRLKAEFFPTPGHEGEVPLHLYEIRKHRRITPEDLEVSDGSRDDQP